MIYKELLFIEEDMKDRNEILNKIVKKAKEMDFIEDEALFLQDVLAREKILPTSIGFEVAMPHGKSEAVKTPFIAYLRIKNNFIWDDRNNEMVHTIFLIGVPKTSGDNTHLRFISQISRNLIDEDFRKELLATKTADETFIVLNQINQNIESK